MARLLFSALLLVLTIPLAAQKLELKKGDHISIIGNNLADRAQHHPHFETLLHARFPEHGLVVRNLGFTGDELKKRDRSSNFGSPDQWLTKNETDVIFAFFGYNAALKGKEQLESFKKDLDQFIVETAGKKYNGESAPRLVLFSPIGREDHDSPHLPEATHYNSDLALYTNVMKEVAAANKVPFVDLFAASMEAYADSRDLLTLNSVHLNAYGYQQLAPAIDGRLFGEHDFSDHARLKKVEAAVRDKNLHWWSRFRTVDGYNVYGGRSGLNWHGQSNADVMKREMEIFDAMTANRDQAIWAAAQGVDHKLDDSNTPPLLETKTNRPGKKEDGSYHYLGGVEAISKMHVHEKLQANLFASEEQFPDLINPVQMAVDTDSRVWVATWPTYPHWNPKEPMNDKLLILPDDDGDGKADQAIVFADQLNSVTGFEFWGGGVLVCALPEILFLKDTNGDDRADVKLRVLQGVSSADTHHSANACVIGPDGGLYFSRGIFNTPNFETPTKTYRPRGSGVYRFDPRTYEVDFVFPIGPNPHGNSFDRFGYQFATDGTSGTGGYVGIGDGTGSHRQFFQKRVRPVPAHGILSSSHFPPEFEGNLLIANAIGFLGVANHTWSWNGSDPTASEVEPIVYSDDPNFRPTDLEVGGDGALYVCDWQNALIGHMQHNMRDPNRDHKHGRVYRFTAKDRPLVKPVKMAGKPIAEIVTHFRAPENGTRYRARLELSGRDTSKVLEVLAKFVKTLDINDPVDAQAMLECLWVHQEHRVPDLGLASATFMAKEPRIRAAVARTAAEWIKVNPALWSWCPLQAADDKDPRVRAEALKGARNLADVRGAEVIFRVASHPMDPHLQHMLDWATRSIKLNEIIDKLSAGNLSLAGERYLIRNSKLDVLLKMERNKAVCFEILHRANVPLADRLDALTKIVEAGKASRVEKLFMTVLKDGPEENLADYAAMLAALPRKELVEELPRIRTLINSKKAALQSGAIAALVNAGESIDEKLRKSTASPEAFSVFLHAVPMIADESARKELYQSLRHFALALPETLRSAAPQADPTIAGVNFEWYGPGSNSAALGSFKPRKPELTGEVEHFTHTVPGHKGDAFALKLTSHLIVTNPGEYTLFVSSDDGSRLYLNGKELINNDGNHGPAEKAGKATLGTGSHEIIVTYFDSGGGDALQVSWQGPGIPKQAIPPAALAKSGGSDLRETIAKTLFTLPANNSDRFEDLLHLLFARRAMPEVMAHLNARPLTDWPKDGLPALADALAQSVPRTPIELRNTPAFKQSLELGKKLLPLLTDDRAAMLKGALSDLDLVMVHFRTIPEKMQYDRTSFTVRAGKAVHLVLSNDDALPHNLVVAKPGTAQEIAEKAVALGAAGPNRHYIPQHDGILHHTKMLNKGETQTLTFKAPAEPGTYDVVCTYPGHSLLMNAKMRVVK